MNRCLTRFFCALILLLTASAAWAQATAQLSGTVRDESGAVLPGVTVTATQTDTGLVRTAVSDDTGGYLLTNLPIGPYQLEVALQGFRTYVQTGIVLQVGATPTVNAVLGVGTLEESVTVEAATPLVDVRSAGISSVVSNENILELPLQGRQVTDLIVLAGAAVQTGLTERGVPGGVYISVAGEHDQVGDLASLQRKLQDVLVGDDRADARASDVDERCRGFDGDRLLQRADAEHRIDGRRRAHLEHDARLHVGPESLKRDLELVRPDRQVRQEVAPRVIAHGRANETRLGLRRGDGHAGQHGAAFIADRTAQLRCRLRPGGARGQQKDQRAERTIAQTPLLH